MIRKGTKVKVMSLEEIYERMPISVLMVDGKVVFHIDGYIILVDAIKLFGSTATVLSVSGTRVELQGGFLFPASLLTPVVELDSLVKFKSLFQMLSEYPHHINNRGDIIFTLPHDNECEVREFVLTKDKAEYLDDTWWVERIGRTATTFGVEVCGIMFPQEVIVGF